MDYRSPASALARNHPHMEAVSDSFVRQRKSLMIVSLTLLAYISAGVSLETIAILGNTFSVARPSLIPLALWITWGYFATRYYQLYRDMDDDGPTSAYQRYLDSIAIYRARKLAPRELGPQLLEGVSSASVNWSFDDEAIIHRGMAFWTVALSATVRTGAGRTSRVQGFHQTVLVGGRRDRVRAWLAVGLHTRYFTEYGLPVVVGALPVAAWLILKAPFR